MIPQVINEEEFKNIAFCTNPECTAATHREMHEKGTEVKVTCEAGHVGYIHVYDFGSFGRGMYNSTTSIDDDKGKKLVAEVKYRLLNSEYR